MRKNNSTLVTFLAQTGENDIDIMMTTVRYLKNVISIVSLT